MELNRLEKPVPYHVGVKRYYLPFNKGGIEFGLLELFQEVRRTPLCIGLLVEKASPNWIEERREIVVLGFFYSGLNTELTSFLFYSEIDPETLHEED